MRESVPDCVSQVTKSDLLLYLVQHEVFSHPPVKLISQMQSAAVVYSSAVTFSLFSHVHISVFVANSKTSAKTVTPKEFCRFFQKLQAAIA